ncbi:MULTISPECIES: hypothetical protein [unclassified Microcoleus]|uniref:hypothetical protein n=1 Tax=unclassified Microcoleus TaxID=2642155 RepID=UPI002FCFFFBF
MESEERPLYIVVCSRSEEYKLWKTPLKLNGAFCLSSLTQAQIQQYLTRVKLSDLWEKINKFPVILELIKTPLFLSMMTMAYESLSIDEWGSYTTKETCREYLLKVYVERMLTRKIKNLWYPVNKEPKIGEVKYWLSWLANYLKFSSEFYIENLQPNCLENSTHKIIYLTLTNDSLWIKIYSLMVIFLLSFVVGFLVLFNLNFAPFTVFTGWIIFLCGLCVYFDWELWLMFPSLISLGMLFPNFFSFLLSNQASKVIFYFVLVLFPFIYSLFKVLLVLTLHFEYNNSHNWLKKCFGKNYVNDIGTIYILDSLKWSWDDAKKKFMGIFVKSIGFFLVLIGSFSSYSLVQYLQLGKLPHWKGFILILLLLIGSATICGFIATITGIFDGLRFKELELEEKKIPNQGIYSSLINTFRVIVFYTVPSSLFFSILNLFFLILGSLLRDEFNLIYSIKNVFLYGVYLGIIFGFMLSMMPMPVIESYYEDSITSIRISFKGFLSGKGFQLAKVVIQHFILRFLLWFNGHIPWNYARFLNYATERMLLQRVGGRYRFIHRFLQEYFANIK